MKIALAVALLLINTLLFAQEKTFVPIHFYPLYGADTLHLQDSSYQSYSKPNSTDSIEISLFKFYISNIELWKDDKLILKEASSYHLINAADEKTWLIQLAALTKTSFNKIKFNQGIDSATNVSGVQGGNLDPTLGMYWTWQSGYINLKLEGASPQCNTRHNAFEFHLGGYHQPFSSLQTIVLPVVNNDKIDIGVDVKKLLRTLDLTKTNMIMTPSQAAVIVSEKAVEMFSSSHIMMQ